MKPRIDTCACGGPIYATTDGNGRSLEQCDRCEYSRVTPRALEIHHPMHAEHAKAVAEALAAVEAQRGALPLCRNCQVRRVGSLSAERCSECVQERRRQRDREMRRAQKAAAERAA